MAVTLVNEAGTTINCVITGIGETKVQRTAVHDLVTASGDIIQSLGTKSRRFTLKGIVTGSDGSTQLRALPGVTGSLTFVDFWGGNSIPTTEIFYIDVKFTDKGDAPSSRGFTINTIEVV